MRCVIRSFWVPVVVVHFCVQPCHSQEPMPTPVPEYVGVAAPGAVYYAPPSSVPAYPEQPADPRYGAKGHRPWAGDFRSTMLVLFGTPRGFLNQPDNCSRYVLWPLTGHQSKWGNDPFDRSETDPGQCADPTDDPDGRYSPCGRLRHKKGCNDFKSTVLFIFGTPRGFLYPPDNCGRYSLWPCTGHDPDRCGRPCRD